MSGEMVPVTDEQLEIIPQGDLSVVGVQDKSRLDSMIQWAKMNPRSIRRFQDRTMDQCTLNEEVAEQCLYALPRKDKNGNKINIEGPSVRMAEILLRSWRNAGVFARILDDSGDFVTAQAVFIDFEDLTMVSTEVRRRITTAGGNRYSADMITVTSNAAASIARRNAILAAIPRALWNNCYEAARATAAGSLETLEQKRGEAIRWLASKGVDAERVYNALDVSGEQDVGLEQLATLRTLVSQVKQGEMGVDQAFPKPKKEGDAAPAEPAPTKGLAGAKARMKAAEPTPAAAPTSESASS